MPPASSLSAALQPPASGLAVAPSGAEPPRHRRARKTNNPLACTDKNTAQGRRVADLMRAYYRALGNPTEVERQAAIVAAAELQVLAEEARTAALKSGGTVDLDQVVRVQGAADRALRRLGLKPGASEKPFVPMRERIVAARPEEEDDETEDAPGIAVAPAEPTNTETSPSDQEEVDRG